LDLARFSILNNTLGEHVGDEVLRRVAARLRDSVSESRIARVAGDRFALCFPMLDDLRPVTDIVTDEGIRLLELPFAVGDRELHVAARAGCAVFPNDGSDAESLFQNAEAALLGAKSAGTSYRFYAPELNARFASQLDLEARLQRAIEERQFVLYYQPKVDVSTHEVVGFEALIRWNDPERGLVAPGSFIPLLEQTGVIIPVGRWALTEAARQYEEWRAEGLRVPRIAVNLSTVQLRSDRVVDDVKAAVEMFSHECGLDVEVTESMLMENFDTAIAKLTSIRDLGVNLSLDDFGTGYSSLAYIHRLPLNALKIDRSFIVGMTDDPNKTSIVSTIISLGMALRLKIIAEGVEHEEEARLLQLLRCDMIQGYLFGKPEPPELAARRLKR
jgi:diguanylate cyclase (GGDEF)-like protein